MKRESDCSKGMGAGGGYNGGGGGYNGGGGVGVGVLLHIEFIMIMHQCQSTSGHLTDKQLLKPTKMAHGQVCS